MIKKWHRAFVLYRAPYSETSLLLDLFVEKKGKIRVLAKGARRKQSIQKGILQPFTPLIIQYSGQNEIKILTKVEAVSLALPITNLRSLYSAFYLNELLFRVLKAELDSSFLFEVYLNAIQKLALNEPIEPILRQFELCLLEFLGYHVDFEHCYGSGELIEESMFYQYHFEKGFIASLLQNNRTFLGRDLKAMHQKQFITSENLNAAKKFTKMALKLYVGSQPFKSRELFKKL